MPSTEFSQIHAPWTPERHSAEHRVESTIDPGHVLEDLFGDAAAGDACDAIALEPRAALPASWPAQYRFAVVRRGYVIRQRSDARGHTTAIDAVGPGGCFPLERSAESAPPASGGYAVSRTLVALCDEQTVATALQSGGATALQIHELESETIVRMERLADARGRSGTAGKVAALLCVLADTLQFGPGPGHSIPGAFLQRDLAGLLSIRHESVCRALREFSGRDLVERTSDALILKDRAALEAV
jgi:CRP-like cAMP-binding protein